MVRVLVVQDPSEAAQGLASLIESAGGTARVVPDLDAARSMLASERFDFVLAPPGDVLEAPLRSETDGVMSDLLVRISREVRTPMNGILGMTDLALDTHLSSEQREYLRMVRSSAEHLQTILDHVLDFSRRDAGLLAFPERAPETRVLWDARRSPLDVLVVEDNVVSQLLTARILEKRGHRAVVADNGLRALELLAERRFDLVLMDVQMPELDGIQTTLRIREGEAARGGHLPVVAMTALATDRDRERCLAAGMDGYVTKPVQAGRLLAEIDRVLPPPAPSREPVLQVMDRESALARVDGDRALLAMLAGLFLERLPASLDAIRCAIDAADGASLERAAHSLRGSVAIFSAYGAGREAEKLEQMGHEGDLGSAMGALRSLRAEMERLASDLSAVSGESARPDPG